MLILKKLDHVIKATIQLAEDLAENLMGYPRSASLVQVIVNL